MPRNPVVYTSYLEPGYVHLPARTTQLCAVVSFGVVVTLFDSTRQVGGMCHYLFPYRESKTRSTALYAGPAIVALTNMFLDTGSRSEDLEANMYGGACEPGIGPSESLGNDNVKVGEEILERLGIHLVGRDVGGPRGRKIVFTSNTGETAVLKVNRIRSTDWSTDPVARKRRRWSNNK